MPIHLGVKDGKRFVQYGTSGKKYFFTTQKGMEKAYEKAHAQAVAIHATGWTEKK